MFVCECSQHTRIHVTDSTPVVIGTGTADYSEFLSIQHGMNYASCGNMFTNGIGSPGFPPVAWRRAKNK
jgi:hypothetical protein